MALRHVTATTKICAMCQHWNGPVGGREVQPLVNHRSFFKVDYDEQQVCYKQHIEKAAWHSCSEWVRRY